MKGPRAKFLRALIAAGLESWDRVKKVEALRRKLSKRSPGINPAWTHRAAQADECIDDLVHRLLRELSARGLTAGCGNINQMANWLSPAEGADVVLAIQAYALSAHFDLQIDPDKFDLAQVDPATFDVRGLNPDDFK